MKLSKAIFVFLFLFFAFYGRAQSDTTNIKSYTDQVMIRANIDTNIESYIFSQGEGKNENQMTFSINNKTRTSFSVDYKIISAPCLFHPILFQAITMMS
ncbi:hypothetical protein [Chryseobacterium sp. Bi04]|uniref:hypothetical protein n=1 Tax=Chryseobacterium sp. Bi04 TaxID=2822345 RepID=UPI001DB503FE|nr:hypothetical protein [Chryseobacterium sp. Bi04]CAH0131771.1 hypothetical protein SRABI04_00311 [Chryseobacterium sp. Bi04]